MPNPTPPELWDIYDCNRCKTGATIQRGIPMAKGQYHLVVHIWIFNERQETLIQKRAAHLEWLPGKWAATGGSVICGETSLEGAVRELYEEIGIAVAPEAMEFGFTLQRETHFLDIYRTRVEGNKLQFQPTPEVDAVKWVSLEDIAPMVREGEFFPYSYLGGADFRRLAEPRA